VCCCVLVQRGAYCTVCVEIRQYLFLDVLLFVMYTNNENRLQTVLSDVFFRNYNVETPKMEKASATLIEALYLPMKVMHYI
jgi:hypothetical protein